MFNADWRTLTKRLASACLLLAVSAALRPASAANFQGAAAAPPTQLEDFTQTFGPFGIAGEKFTVIARGKRLPQVSGPQQSETLAALEIRDHADGLVYHQKFAYLIADGQFSRALRASACLLPATNGTGLLITYVEEPFEPQGGTFWQLFGFINGKLGLFAPPQSVPTTSGPGPMMGTVIRGSGAGILIAQQGDPVDLRLWTGNFHVVVPILVDWRNARLLPAQRCFESGGVAGLRERGCDLRVEARRSVRAEHGVRLFSEPQEDAAVRHVVVNKDSQVDFLMARGIIRWTIKGDVLQASLPDLWLKVLIDNDDQKEGWIHTEEEFQAAGLPFASSQP